MPPIIPTPAKAASPGSRPCIGAAAAAGCTGCTVPTEPNLLLGRAAGEGRSDKGASREASRAAAACAAAL
eukprot:scaffold86250_cov36-Phaeocystis_antarctica.AAC.2